MAEGEGLAGRAESIAVEKLSSAVQAAVREVSAKHGLKVGNNLVFKPGMLIGRQVLEAITDLKAAEAMAAELAAHVQRAGVGGGAELSPGVLVQGGRILLGYFPSNEVFEAASVGG